MIYIESVENGYLVEVGSRNVGSMGRRYIAKDETQLGDLVAELASQSKPTEKEGASGPVS